MLESGLVDCMAHLDLVKIFGFRPTQNFDELLDAVLSEIREVDLALELSTAGWRKPVNEIYPSEEIIRRAMKKEIPFTTASDGHSHVQQGENFERLAQKMAELGIARWRFTSNTNGGWWRCRGSASSRRGLAARSLRRAFWQHLLFYAPRSSGRRPPPNDKVFADVVRQAREIAHTPCQSGEIALPETFQQLTYDTYRIITFRREEGLWFGQPSRFQVQFFHPGYIYKQPVAIYEVDHGKVRPVRFSPKFFRYPRLAPPFTWPDAKLGFAGFRLLYPLDHDRPVDEVISIARSELFPRSRSRTGLRHFRPRTRDRHGGKSAGRISHLSRLLAL